MWRTPDRESVGSGLLRRLGDQLRPDDYEEHRNGGHDHARDQPHLPVAADVEQVAPAGSRWGRSSTGAGLSRWRQPPPERVVTGAGTALQRLQLIRQLPTVRPISSTPLLTDLRRVQEMSNGAGPGRGQHREGCHLGIGSYPG